MGLERERVKEEGGTERGKESEVERERWRDRGAGGRACVAERLSSHVCHLLLVSSVSLLLAPKSS